MRLSEYRTPGAKALIQQGWRRHRQLSFVASVIAWPEVDPSIRPPHDDHGITLMHADGRRRYITHYPTPPEPPRPDVLSDPVRHKCENWARKYHLNARPCDPLIDGDYSAIAYERIGEVSSLGAFCIDRIIVCYSPQRCYCRRDELFAAAIEWAEDRRFTDPEAFARKVVRWAQSRDVYISSRWVKKIDGRWKVQRPQRPRRQKFRGFWLPPR